VDEDDEKMVDAVSRVATALKYLGNGDASTTFGAIEGHAMQVEKVAAALDSIAGSLERIAQSFEDKED